MPNNSFNKAPRPESMEQLKIYASIAGSSFMRWLALVVSGLLLSLAGLVVSAFLLSGHADLTGMPAILKQEFWAVVLLLASLILPIAYVLLANRIALGRVLFQIFEYQLAPAVGNRIANLVGRLISSQAGVGNVIGNVSALRDKLVAMSSEESTLHKLQHRILRYGLTRARLDDIDFRRTDLNLPEVVAGRVVDALKAGAEPTYLTFWVVAAGHLALFAFALIFAQS